MKLYLLGLFLIFFQLFSFCQTETTKIVDENEYFIKTIEECVKLFYEDYTTLSSKDSIEKVVQFESGVIPEYPDSVICQRLSELNEKVHFIWIAIPLLYLLSDFLQTKREVLLRLSLVDLIYILICTNQNLQNMTCPMN